MIEYYAYEIDVALQNNCWFAALALSLTLPDICGMVAFPEETSVLRRYIQWCDTYLIDDEPGLEGHKAPRISGEIVCNLRNTFLHTGSPTINSNKVQYERNQLDKFMLLMGDVPSIRFFSACIEIPNVTYRSITINVNWLCRIIYERAVWYYQNNQERFHFDFVADTAEHFFAPDTEIPPGDPIVRALNQKLEKRGETRRFVEHPEHTIVNSITTGFEKVFSDQSLKKKMMAGQTVTSDHFKIKRTVIASHPKPSSACKRVKTVPDRIPQPHYSAKRETQVRSFFGQHFKEKKYGQKKEQIIQAVLSSVTKQQVNNALMKCFSSEEAGSIYKRLLPLLKNYPGK